MTQTYTSPRYISVADTAKLVRKELKSAFPGIKFSVRSDSYAGGASIRIKWVDGPTTDAVDAVVKQYQGASFDGMIDLKSYHDSELNGEPVHFGADYVFTDRDLSIDFLTKVTAWYCKRFGYAMPVIKESYAKDGTGYIDDTVFIPQQNAYLSTLVYREHHKIDAQYIDNLEAIQALADWMDFMAYRVYGPIVEEEEDLARMESLECEIIPMYEGMVARNEEDAEHGLHVCRHELAQLQKKYGIVAPEPTQTLVTIMESLPFAETRIRILYPEEKMAVRAWVGGEIALHLKRYNAKLVTTEVFEQELERHQ